MIRHLGSVCSAAAAVALLASPAIAQTQAKPQAKPDGTIDLTERSVAAGVGYTWGGGTLHHGGKTYPLTVKGVSVVDVGISKFTARGDVYRLKQVSDIDGVYRAVAASATVGEGRGVATLENGKGVQIKLKSSSEGLQFKLAPEGVSIKMK